MASRSLADPTIKLQMLPFDIFTPCRYISFILDRQISVFKTGPLVGATNEIPRKTHTETHQHCT